MLASGSSFRSKRNVVGVNVVLRILDSLELFLLLCGLRGGRPSGGPGCAPLRPELHAVGDDLGAVALRATLGVPAARLEPALDERGVPLLEVLRGRLRLAPEDDDVVELRVLFAIPVFVVVHAVRREPERRDRGARRERLEL